MYLAEIYIENSGPISKLSLTLPFSAEGTPKPVILVGENGSGKTNLLSSIADALIQAASVGYEDIVPSAGMKRPWFRIVGPGTISAGASSGCTLLRFTHAGQTHWSFEQIGQLAHEDLQARLPESMRGVPSWPKVSASKDFPITEEAARQIFGSGAYAYFPSSRAEVPHWLNTESLTEESLDFTPRFSTRLGRPVYVERGLAQVRQWLSSLLVDALMPQFQKTGASALWAHANRVVSAILGNGMALGWAGRKSNNRLTLHRPGSAPLPSFMSVSAGQATLLSVFGNLLRYGDLASPVLQGPDEIVGICLVDEIDAHQHIKLQHEVLPALIKMFPKVQFILSSHSPLFVLGMERTFEPNGVSIIDMPSGAPIQAEAYSEFGHALEALEGTKAFNAKIEEWVAHPGKLLVLLEGETDPIYMRAAAELLERQAILDDVEFEWIGAKDPKGQGFNTGSGALNSAFSLFRSKPEFVRRSILLLYDHDAKKTAEDHGKLHVRAVPYNSRNNRFRKGIENLLPEMNVPEEMLEISVKTDDYGCENTNKRLNKMKLCLHLCQEKREKGHFAGFVPVLDTIERLLGNASS